MISRRWLLVVATLFVLVLASGLAAADTTDEADTLEYDLEVPADGEVYTVAVPGETDQTIGELFPEGTAGLGAIYTYDDGWVRITDLEAPAEPMTAYVLVTLDSGSSMPVTVGITAETAGVERSLQAGWNLVPGQAYIDAETSYDDLEGVLLLDRFDRANAGDLPTVLSFGHHVFDVPGDRQAVDPFNGYFLYLEEAASFESATNTVDTQSATGDPDPLRVADPDLPFERYDLKVDETIPEGATGQATVTGWHEGGLYVNHTRPATLTSSNETVATVTDGGTVTGHHQGEMNISASLEQWNETASVTVTEPVVEDLSLEAPAVFGAGNETVVVSGTLTNGTEFNDTEQVSLTSSDSGVLAVEADGTLVPAGGGTATITAERDGVSAAAEVIVEEPVPFQATIQGGQFTFDTGDWPVERPFLECEGDDPGNENLTEDPVHEEEWLQVGEEDGAIAYNEPRCGELRGKDYNGIYTAAGDNVTFPTIWLHDAADEHTFEDLYFWFGGYGSSYTGHSDDDELESQPDLGGTISPSAGTMTLEGDLYLYFEAYGTELSGDVGCSYWLEGLTATTGSDGALEGSTLVEKNEIYAGNLVENSFNFVMEEPIWGGGWTGHVSCSDELEFAPLEEGEGSLEMPIHLEYDE